jgi:hypothetical protein
MITNDYINLCTCNEKGLQKIPIGHYMPNCLIIFVCNSFL